MAFYRFYQGLNPLFESSFLMEEEEMGAVLAILNERIPPVKAVRSFQQQQQSFDWSEAEKWLSGFVPGKPEHSRSHIVQSVSSDFTSKVDDRSTKKVKKSKPDTLKKSQSKLASKKEFVVSVYMDDIHIYGRHLIFPSFDEAEQFVEFLRSRGRKAHWRKEAYKSDLPAIEFEMSLISNWLSNHVILKSHKKLIKALRTGQLNVKQANASDASRRPVKSSESIKLRRYETIESLPVTANIYIDDLLINGTPLTFSRFGLLHMLIATLRACGGKNVRFEKTAATGLPINTEQVILLLRSTPGLDGECVKEKISELQYNGSERDENSSTTSSQPAAHQYAFRVHEWKSEFQNGGYTHFPPSEYK